MPQLTIQQAFELAARHHQAGHLGPAEQIYRQILAKEPQHVEALHLLGVIAFQSGRNDLAMDLIRQAIGLKADYAEAYSNLGLVLAAARRLEEAVAAYERAIALMANYPQAYGNLGNALRELGRLDEAIVAYRHAVALRPDYAEVQNKLGMALQEKGLIDEAIAAYQQTIRIKPDHAEAWSNLGNALSDAGKAEEAIAAYRQALAVKPKFAEAYSNLGSALFEHGRLEEAIAACRQAITLNPNLPQAHGNLANALRETGRQDEAIAGYRRAIALKPDFMDAHSNLGTALWDKGQLHEAIAACRQAIALDGDSAEAHHNLAQMLLLKGEFAQGWEEHEWRWRCKGFTSPRPGPGEKDWDGSPLQGRSIVLYAEQGFGDTLQFIRYLPSVIQRGGRTIVECQPALRRLLQMMAGNGPVVARGSAMPEFDVQCPLMSLPRVFGTTLVSIPGNVPYLQADAGEVEKWQNRVANDSVKVGLLWAGRASHRNDRNRSMALSKFAPLADVPGVRFYSLQKGPAAEQARSAPVGMELIDWTEELSDFADTAALIANLDLVVSVDTAVVHLAGAMGKPVWTLLPFAPDWRWLLNRADSPWYPTMRLFRQLAIGDWDSVVRQVVERLRTWPH